MWRRTEKPIAGATLQLQGVSVDKSVQNTRLEYMKQILVPHHLGGGDVEGIDEEIKKILQSQETDNMSMDTV